MNRRWICSDVWMDILPSFDRPKLGLKMALLSDRFDVLVDAHFDGKTTELTIWKEIKIRKDMEDEEIGQKAKLSVLMDGKFVDFPMPDHPLPNKIRFLFLLIEYIDHSVIEFLRSNQHIWDRSGIKLKLFVCANKKEDEQPIWNAFVPEIWPIISTRIRHLRFTDGDHLDNLRRLISPTILSDLDQLNSIDSRRLFPDGIADDGPNATAGQALTKWLHTPGKDGQPKELYRNNFFGQLNLEWLNNFKETFRRATTSVSYNIWFNLYLVNMPIEQFELVNERTNEKLRLMKKAGSAEFLSAWLLERSPILAETATVQWKDDENLDHLNRIYFFLCGNCIGPLSPPGQSDEKVFSTKGPSDQRKKKK